MESLSKHVLYFKREKFNELCQKKVEFLNEISSKQTVISAKKVLDTINGIFDFITVGIIEDYNPLTPNLSDTNSAKNDSQNNDNNNESILIDSQTTESSQPKTISIEDRMEKLEKLIEKMVNNDNNNRNHVRAIKSNGNFQKKYNKSQISNNTLMPNTSQMSKTNEKSNFNIKSCFICKRPGHLSYNCYYNPNNMKNNNRIFRNSNYRSGHQQNTQIRHQNNNGYYYQRNINPNNFLDIPSQEIPGPPHQCYCWANQMQTN